MDFKAIFQNFKNVFSFKPRTLIVRYDTKDVKIILAENFRSKKSVIDSINYIFLPLPLSTSPKTNARVVFC